MRLTANSALLATAMLAGCCASDHCGDSYDCCAPACGAPGYHAVNPGGQPLPPPIPDGTPPIEPAEEAPEPPPRY